MEIIIEFRDGGCEWHSVGWGNDAKAMAAAKEAINKAETEEEVIRELQRAGFEVIEWQG